MDNVYESIITGLTEAIEDAKGQKKNYIEEHILLSERYEDQLKAVEWAKAEQAITPFGKNFDIAKFKGNSMIIKTSILLLVFF